MPMVRRGDENRGNGLVFENHAQVLDGLRLGALLRDEVGSEFRGAIVIRVADISDLAVRKTGQFGRVLFTTNAAADNGHGDFVVGAHRPWFRSDDSRGNGRAGRSGRSENGVFKKPSASDV